MQSQNLWKLPPQYSRRCRNDNNKGLFVSRRSILVLALPFQFPLTLYILNSHSPNVGANLKEGKDLLLQYYSILFNPSIPPYILMQRAMLWDNPSGRHPPSRRLGVLLPCGFGRVQMLCPHFSVSLPVFLSIFAPYQLISTHPNSH